MITSDPEYQKLRRAVRRYLRAKDDTSWGPRKNWHKRHDKGKAEAKLRELVNM